MLKRAAIVLLFAASMVAFGEDNPNGHCIDSLGVADADVTNVASLQKGARNFVNYCLGCHSLGGCRADAAAGAGDDDSLAREQAHGGVLRPGLRCAGMRGVRSAKGKGQGTAGRRAACGRRRSDRAVGFPAIAKQNNS